MLYRIPIALVQVQARNASEYLINGAHQIIYSFHQSKEITKKVYNNVMNPVKV